jgi:hypothetical protein
MKHMALQLHTKNSLYMLFLCVLVGCSSVYGGTRLHANGENETFNHYVDSLIFNNAIDVFYVSSSDAHDEDGVGLYCARRSDSSFTSLVPEHITLHGQKDIENPLYHKGINHIALFGNHILCSSPDYQSSLFLIDPRNPENMSMMSLDNLKNAHGENADNIDLFVSTLAGRKSLEQDVQPFAFVALSNKEKNYNGDGSGIALVSVKHVAVDTPQASDKKRSADISKSDDMFTPHRDSTDEQRDNSHTEQSDSSSEPQEKTSVKKEKRLIQLQAYKHHEGDDDNQSYYALPIDRSTDALKVGGNLSSVESINDMYWDSSLRLLFVACTTVAGPDDNDGAYGVCVGSYNNNELSLTRIMPQQVVDSDTGILAQKGAHARMSVKKVRTMHTSTHLPYLVTLSEDNKVHALALVSRHETLYGKVAGRDSKPYMLFGQSYPHRFLQKHFIDPALKSDDVSAPDDAHVRVGGDVSLKGTITDIHVLDDAVFVAVENKDDVIHEGIFFSRALFDETGRVIGWTQWQKNFAIRHGITAMDFDIKLNNVWYISGNKQSVYTTGWSQGDSKIEKHIQDIFPSDKGGVHFVKSIPYMLSADNDHRCSSGITMLAGYKKIALLELGSTYSSLHSDSIDPLVFSIDAQHITSSDIISHNGKNILTVSSDTGTYILADKDGKGWSQSHELTPDMLADTSFKRINNIKNVIKVSCCRDNFYILTKKGLYAQRIGSDYNDYTTLASSGSEDIYFHKILNDIVITPHMILLGTSEGLLVRFKNGHSWQKITLPECVGYLYGVAPVVKMHGVTQSGSMCDGYSDEGNIYVVNGYQGWHQSCVYRLYVSKDSVRLISDYFVKDQPSFFLDLGEYYNTLFIDGGYLLAAHNKRYVTGFEDFRGDMIKQTEVPPCVNIFKKGIKAGRRGAFVDAISPELNIHDNTSITSIDRSMHTGCIIVSGDFGIRMNK